MTHCRPHRFVGVVGWKWRELGMLATSCESGQTVYHCVTASLMTQILRARAGYAVRSNQEDRA